jgi:hypothetical protein
MPGVPDEEAVRLSESLKIGLKSLLERNVPGRVKILPGVETQCIEISERWREDRAQR